MSFFNELKRRNVFRVAAAYIIVGWLIMQVGDTLAPALHLPEWINSALAFFLILGFPLAIFFAWAFEMTPEGIMKQKDIDRDHSITHLTGQKLNHVVLGLLVLAVGYFAFDKFVLDPGRDAAEIQTAVQAAQQQAPEQESSSDNSIAVLPFVNMSSDPEQEYFSDGLSEELLNLLAQVPELRVAARTSSFSFRGQNLEIPEIANRLGVANVLEGSVRKSGNQVRITAQLIQADEGFHLWSETFDRELDNVFQIQDEIAAAVVDSLKVTLLGEAPRVTETDPEAYQIYLEGKYIGYRRTPEALAESIELFKQAVEIDPGYAPAWTELSWAYLWYTGSGNMPINEGTAAADQAIENALKADPEYGLAHVIHGILLAFVHYEFAKSVDAFRRAYELDPGNAMSVQYRGFAESLEGNFNEAIEFGEQGILLDPVMPDLHTNMGNIYWRAGRLDEAIASYRKALSLTPEYIGNRHRIARMLIHKGEPEAALEMALKELDDIYRLTATSMAHFALGQRAEADRALEELIEIGSEDAAYQIAQVYGMRGNANKAFEWLNQAIDNGDSGVGQLMGDSSFFPVVNDPRFGQVMERIGLAEVWRALPPEWGGPRS